MGLGVCGAGCLWGYRTAKPWGRGTMGLWGCRTAGLWDCRTMGLWDLLLLSEPCGAKLLSASDEVEEP